MGKKDDQVVREFLVRDAPNVGQVYGRTSKPPKMLVVVAEDGKEYVCTDQEGKAIHLTPASRVEL